MNYKFLSITAAVEEFIEPFLQKNYKEGSISYDELYRKFCDTKYAWSDFYSMHINKMGNEGRDIYANIEPLQKQWAKENNIKYSEENWLKEIVLEQIKFYKPDILYIYDLYLFDQEFRKTVRDNVKIKIVGWRFAVTKDYSVFKDLDLLLTGNHDFVNRFRPHGINTAYFPHSFEQSILDEFENTDNRNRDYNFTFVGSTGSPNGIHSERFLMIKHLMENTQLELWTSSESGVFSDTPLGLWNKIIYNSYLSLNSISGSKNTSFKSLIDTLPVIRRGKYISEQNYQPLHKVFSNRVHSSVYGIDGFRVMSRSKIVFNKHIDTAQKSGGNIRLFEATGMGACLLTDHIENIKDFFEPDYEVVTYKSKEEAVEKYNYLINNEKEREKIAAAGKKKTLEKHTLQQRMYKFNEYCLDLLK